MWILSLLLSPLFLGVTPATYPTTRPGHDREPWVFRCVLDGNARSVVVSLGQHRWVAYDAATCSLVKFWVGDIELTGPVYDYKHGPQPRAQGALLLSRKATISRVGPQVEVSTSSFPLLGTAATSADNATTTKPDRPESTTPFDAKFSYRGYTKTADVVTFHYEHQDARYDKTPVRIDETPSTSVTADGTTIFRRRIIATFPKSETPTLDVYIELPTSKSVNRVRLIEGKASHVPNPNLLQHNELVAPADVPISENSNATIALGESGTIVIDTELNAVESADAKK